MPLYKIKKTNIDRKGYGLCATKNIKKGTKIINYIGKIITKKQTELSKKYDNTKPIYLYFRVCVSFGRWFWSNLCI